MWILDRWQMRLQLYIDEAQLPSSYKFMFCSVSETRSERSFFQRLGVVAIKSGMAILCPRKQRILLTGLQQMRDQMEVHTGSYQSTAIFFDTIKQSIQTFTKAKARLNTVYLYAPFA